jgi:muramoyltetrapeptide carboxypeptidase
MRVLQEWGLLPQVLEVGPPHGYLAGTDEARGRTLRQALASQPGGFRAVLCGRGGYGALRLLEASGWNLDAAPPGPASPWLVGASDVTVLLAPRAAAGYPGCIYGPMPASPAFHGPDASNREALRGLLMGELQELSLEGRTVVPGTAQGPLRGGCLSLIAALAATPMRLRLAGAILLLEEVGEPPFRLDRMLTTLRLGGHLEGIRGVAVGSLHRCSLEPPEADALLLDRLGDLGVPVVAGLGFGHGERQHPLVLDGPTARLAASPTTALLHQPLPWPTLE